MLTSVKTARYTSDCYKAPVKDKDAGGSKSFVKESFHSKLNFSEIVGESASLQSPRPMLPF